MLHRPYIWLGEDHDTHVADFRRLEAACEKKLVLPKITYTSSYGDNVECLSSSCGVCHPDVKSLRAWSEGGLIEPIIPSRPDPKSEMGTFLLKQASIFAISVGITGLIFKYVVLWLGF